jgi:hypothetical protein
MSADPSIAGAVETLAKLNDIGSYAYAQNAPTLIQEAATRAAVADAVTNRIRLLHDLLDSRPAALAFNHRVSREAAIDEYDRLVRSVVVTDAEA